MKYNISLIIPHKNRHGLLLWTLNELKRNQILKNYEVIVVDDHSDTPLPDLPDGVVVKSNPGVGPGAARNYGAEIANSDIVLFTGDDCIPDRGLLFQHYHAHLRHDGPIAVQGYSPFHPLIMGDKFMHWLNSSGIQANWAALQNEDGSYRENVDGFCLTTNYSINKKEFFNLGGFDSKYFKKAAWEDIALGYAANVAKLPTKFAPSAINYHFHSYDLFSFAKRQDMVGRCVPSLGLKHSEMGAELIKPEELRAARLNSIGEWLQMYKEMRYVNNVEDFWGQVLRLAMTVGIQAELDELGKYWKVFEHLHKKEAVVHALECIRGINDDNYGWAMHNCAWLIQDSPDNWAVYCFIAEVNKHFGHMDDAQKNIQKSLEISPNNWGPGIIT